jgi:hypothetical protein
MKNKIIDMKNKIIDIYNLDKLKSDSDYFTMRITIQNDEICSLEIDGETHNKNKIIITKKKTYSTILDINNIITEHGYNNCMIGIKFKIKELEQN